VKKALINLVLCPVENAWIACPVQENNVIFRCSADFCRYPPAFQKIPSFFYFFEFEEKAIKILSVQNLYYEPVIGAG
jgi:hypothetical protein